MITAKIADNEDERLQELLKYEMLDTPEDQIKILIKIFSSGRGDLRFRPFESMNHEEIGLQIHQ